MKRNLLTFAHDLESFCARLNDGLTAVAVLLAFMVMTMAIVRAQDFMPNALATVPSGYQLTLGY